MLLSSQDTPGMNYCQPTTSILDHITAKNNAYLALEQDPQRHVPMSAVEDMRVDACLFFINPNSLKPEELSAMADLAKLVPVVPMIAKVPVPCTRVSNYYTAMLLWQHLRCLYRLCP